LFKKSRLIVIGLLLTLLLATLYFGSTVSQAQATTKPYLGIEVDGSGSGNEITKVDPGSPAESGGLRVGDVILNVGSETVTPTNTIDAILSRYRPGLRIIVTVKRGSQIVQNAVVLSQVPTPTATATPNTDLLTASAAPTQTDTLLATLVSPIDSPSLTPTSVGASPVIVTPLAPNVAFLGVSPVDSPDGVRIVQVVPGSAADAAGIRPGDIIVTFDNTPIRSAAQLPPLVSGHKPGDSVTLSIRRDDKLIDLTVVLTARLPLRPVPLIPPGVTPVIPAPSTLPSPAVFNLPRLGMRLFAGQNGLTVIDVTPDGSAAHSGLLRGDVIIEIDGQPYAPPPDALRILGSLFAANRPIQIKVLRNNAQISLTLLPASPLNLPTPFPLPTRPPIFITPIAPPNIIPPQTGQLGVVYETVTPQLSAARGLPIDYGALIDQVVPGSPADVAGIRPGDIITAVDGDKVDPRRTLSYRMIPYRLGDTLTLTVMRAGQSMDISVTLATRGIA
jgi:S1-C subfamily serine protease